MIINRRVINGDGHELRETHINVERVIYVYIYGRRLGEESVTKNHLAVYNNYAGRRSSVRLP